MADGKHWFKVYASILTDPTMAECHNDIVGAWVRLGALVAQHGEKGSITISMDYLLRTLHLFKADGVTIERFFDALKSLNILIVKCNEGFTVTFEKWHKYQVDNSSERVRKYRENVTVQEEKRREENKKRKEKNKDVRRFTPPSLEEIKNYCDERGNGIDAQAFLDFYESKGWKVGSTPMKDWRAAIRTWERKQKERQGQFI